MIVSEAPECLNYFFHCILITVTVTVTAAPIAISVPVAEVTLLLLELTIVHHLLLVATTTHPMSHLLPHVMAVAVAHSHVVAKAAMAGLAHEVSARGLACRVLIRIICLSLTVAYFCFIHCIVV